MKHLCFRVPSTLPGYAGGKVRAMIVHRHKVVFDSISLDSGETLTPVEVAYESYGELNADKSNAVLITHAFSGDAHAAGVSDIDGKPAGGRT